MVNASVECAIVDKGQVSVVTQISKCLAGGCSGNFGAPLPTASDDIGKDRSIYDVVDDADNATGFDSVVSSVAYLLHLFACHSKFSGGRITIFDSASLPNVSVHHFLTSLLDGLGCSPECCVLAFIYIDRFMRHIPQFTITFTNVHRLLLTSVVVAAKFVDDAQSTDQPYAKLAPCLASIDYLSPGHVMSMELYLMQGLDWRLHVSCKDFDECLALMRNWAHRSPEKPANLGASLVPRRRRWRKPSSSAASSKDLTPRNRCRRQG